MYEVTYSIDGIIKTINVNANDSLSVTNIMTNMFSGKNIQIINIRRI